METRGGGNLEAMRFESRHPTDVPDEQAELIFLALATKWGDVDKNGLAESFVAGSVYIGSLPPAFGVNVSDRWSSARIGGTVGVLMDGLELDAFRVHVVDRQGIDLTVVAASDASALSVLWSRGDGYGARDELVIRRAEGDYEKRHGESHRDTLRRAANENC